MFPLRCRATFIPVTWQSREPSILDWLRVAKHMRRAANEFRQGQQLSGVRT